MASCSVIPDLIFVSLEDWDDIWRRNQFVCAGLARRYPDMKLLFVAPARDVSHAVRRGRLTDLRADATRRVPGIPNITVTRPLKLFPNSLTAGRRCNEAMARLHVRRAARALGLTRPLLWLNPHYAVHMAGRMGERGVVYDITDDWTLMTASPREQQLTTAQDRRLCARADLVVVCSEALLQSRSALSRRILHLPNGVDPAHYRAQPDEMAAEARDWPAPVLMYTGTLHMDRIDTDLVRDVARAFPRGAIVFVGPNHMPPSVTAGLAAEPNVKLLGPRRYAELPAYMARADLFIVPHRETPFTESLNPLKLLEYMAAGKPVVATNVAGFRDYPDLCRIASGAAAFTAACRAALADGDTNREARQEVAARNSWDSRLDCLLATLKTMGLTE